MTDHQHAVPDCAGRNGALDWTVHQYGYERYVVLDERGHEVAATHRQETARLIAAAPVLLEAMRVVAGGDNWRCFVDEEWDIVNDAIAKAEGRP